MLDRIRIGADVLDSCGVTLLIGVAAFGLGCASMRTTVDFDRDVDFGAWKTFAWYPAGTIASGDHRFDNALIHVRIERAVYRELVERGYSEALAGEPDFYVNFHLVSEQRTRVHTVDRIYVGGPHRRGWHGRTWSTHAWPESRVEHFEEGTLIIDAIDAAGARLAWRGTGVRRLTRETRPERFTELVNEAVAKILEPFPPGS